MIELLMSSSALIGAILVIRGLLGRRMSMRLRYGLWGLVLLRLLLPVWLPGKTAGFYVPVPLEVREVRRQETPVLTAPEHTAQPQTTEVAEAPSPLPVLTERGLRPGVIRAVWLMGLCGVGGYLLLANLLLYRRLHRNAVPLEIVCPVPVYQTQDLAAPCLAGLLHPRIYVPDVLPRQVDIQYMLAHECCHLRHGDNWWALLRGICLAVWWFHPLVWVAAVYARRDCELACDEAVLDRLGWEARNPYGETLVALAAKQRGGLLYASASMTGGSVMKQRLKQLLHGRRQLWATVLALVLALLAAACAFTEAPDTSLALSKGNKSVDGAPPQQEGNRTGVYTFLLVGVSDVGGMTDTLLLARYDTVGGELNVLSIPRDTMVDIPYDIKRINGVWALSGGGIQGRTALVREVERLVGFVPDYVVTVGWQAVGELVDALGGVPFEVPMDMDYDDPVQDLHIHITKGYQVLDGTQAMGVIRYRRGNDQNGYVNGDLGRVETQQAFLQALAGKLLSFQSLPKLAELVDLIQAHTDTDLSRDALLWFAKTAVLDGVTQIRFLTLPTEPQAVWSETYQCHQSYLVPQKGPVLELVNQYLNPCQTPRTAADLALPSIAE